MTKRPADRSASEQRQIDEARKQRRNAQQNARRRRAAQTSGTAQAADRSAEEADQGGSRAIPAPPPERAGPTDGPRTPPPLPPVLQRVAASGRSPIPPNDRSDRSAEEALALQSIESDLQGLDLPLCSGGNDPDDEQGLSEDEGGPLGAVSNQRSQGDGAAEGPSLRRSVEQLFYAADDPDDWVHALVPTPQAREASAPPSATGRIATPTARHIFRRFAFALDDAPLRDTAPVGHDFAALGGRESVSSCRNTPSVDPTTPTDFAHSRILSSLRLDGCTCDKRATRHTHTAEDRSLAQLVQDWRDRFQVPDILSIVGQHKRLPTFPSEDISRTDWQALLAGVEGHRDAAPTRLSLERSDLLQTGRPVRIRRVWDVDALIIPITTLGAHRQGLDLIFYPRFTKTISQSWHTPVTPQNIIPRECKHLRLARGTGTAEFDTYIFFPKIPVKPKARGVAAADSQGRCYLTDQEQRVWIDSILLPAIREVYGQDVLQHLPRTFDEAVDRSRAQQRENASSADRSFKELAYHLPNRGEATPELARLWAVVQERIAYDSIFAGAELVDVTYGCKLQYRRPCLSRLQRYVDQSLTDRFDRSFLNLDYAFVDLAYEDVLDEETGPAEPVVLLRRAACNEADMDGLGLGKAAQSFQWLGTAEASSIRATPSKRSPLRTGKVTYVQAYNVIKDIFVHPSRSTGPLFSDPALPFLAYTRQTFQRLQQIAQDPRSYSPAHFDRIRDALKATIAHLDQSLRSNARSSNGFGTRQEYRIAFSLFLALDVPDRSPTLPQTTPESPAGSVASDRQSRSACHWPFYALPKAEVLDFVRWQLNRWLFAICSVICVPTATARAGQLASSLRTQQLYTATASALFSCLCATANSEDLSLQNRVAYATYYRPAEPVRQGPEAITDQLWEITARSGRTRTGASGRRAAGPVPAPVRAQGAAGEPVFRRGLGLLDSLHKSNHVWLPVTLFHWDRLCFVEDVLVDTAFVTPRFRALYQSRQSSDEDDCVRKVVDQALSGLTPDLFTREKLPLQGRNTLERLNVAAWTLWNICIFGCSHDILRRLSTDQSDRASSDRLPEFWSDRLTDEERQGWHGLSYGLIQRATGHEPVISWSRSAGGRQSAGGFSSFPNTWEARIALLFDWDDGFRRSNWDNARWRLWFRYCYSQLANATGLELAERWRKGLPRYAADKLTILPRYEADKLFQFEKITTNISTGLRLRREQRRSLKWIAAVPVTLCGQSLGGGGPGCAQASAGPGRAPPLQRWQMLVREGTHCTPNTLPHLAALQPGLVNGKRLKFIDGLTVDPVEGGEAEGADASGHDGEGAAPPTPPPP